MKCSPKSSTTEYRYYEKFNYSLPFSRRRLLIAIAAETKTDINRSRYRQNGRLGLRSGPGFNAGRRR
jgi:hypothetical protein